MRSGLVGGAFRGHGFHRHDLKFQFLFRTEVVQHVLFGRVHAQGILDQLLAGRRARLGVLVCDAVLDAVYFSVKLRFDLRLGWLGQWLLGPWRGGKRAIGRPGSRIRLFQGFPPLRQILRIEAVLAIAFIIVLARMGTGSGMPPQQLLTPRTFVS